jgi:two-component system LytT family sensor kinase
MEEELLASADRPTRRFYLLIVFAALPVGLLLNAAKLVALWVERRPPEWSEVGVSLASSLAWIALVPILIAAVHRLPLNSRAWKRNLFLLAIVGALLAVAAESLYVIGVALFTAITSRNVPFEIGEAWRTALASGGITVNVMLFAGTVAATYALDTFQRNRERARRSLRLEARLAETRLQLLRMQLHPHFLFNALNAVTALIDEEPKAADQMLSRLIDFFEFSLDEVGRQEVTVEHELTFLRNYVAIEQTRFGERLKVEFDVDPSSLPLFVPGLLLQPIVENAIRHGIAPRAQQGSVCVRTKVEGAQLRIVIEDDGVGLDSRKGDRAGIGLGNTRQRLEHLYGRHQRLTIEAREGGGTRVDIALPARRSPLLDQLRRETA